MNEKIYGTKFYDRIDDGSVRSAVIVLSIIKEFLDVGSVIDLGCGTGSWIRAVQEVFGLEAQQVVGVEGAYAKPRHGGLKNRFVYSDLRQSFRCEERFSMAMSQEVAEHLPEDRACGFVADLCDLSPVILFSAATPGQGGTGHVNEQWPDYWMKKFSEHGYLLFDPIRPRVWMNEYIEPWYAQNCFLYVHENEAEVIGKLAFCQLAEQDWRLRLVHPGIFRMAACESTGAGRLLRALPDRLAFTLRTKAGWA